jgi:hypothetical protein
VTTDELMKPSAAILVKLGSIVVHAEELLSPNGHEFDSEAIRSGLQDAELQEWIRGMTELAFLPVKRNARPSKKNKKK